MSAIQSLKFELFADYFQFYLQDESATGDLSASWDQIATDRMLAVAEGVIGVGTARNMTVPVLLELHKKEPAADVADWDHVMECGLAITSNKIVIAGCSDYFPDAARVDVAPGYYRARVSYGRLNELSANGLEGDDHYRVQLWPGTPVDPHVLKHQAS